MQPRQYYIHVRQFDRARQHKMTGCPAFNLIQKLSARIEFQAEEMFNW